MNRDAAKSEALRLRTENGWGYQRIGRAIGVSHATVFRWLNPEYAERGRAAARAWKARVRGTCAECGTETRYNGHGDNNLPSEMCVPCANKARAKWTPEIIVARIREWTEIHRDPPAAQDWNPALSRQVGDDLSALQFEAANGYWPNTSTVIAYFGQWNAAIEAAGFQPRKIGGRGKGRRWVEAA